MVSRFVTEGCEDCKEFGEFEFRPESPHTICTPGKFEAEEDFAVHFYHLSLDGGNGCDVCDYGDAFEIEAAEVALFPELADSIGLTAHVHTSDQGFVYCQILTAAEMAVHSEEEEEAEEEKAAINCDQCVAAMINGVFCHETGCPNIGKVWIEEEDRWVRPESEEEEAAEDFDLLEEEEASN